MNLPITEAITWSTDWEANPNDQSLVVLPCTNAIQFFDYVGTFPNFFNRPWIQSIKNPGTIKIDTAYVGKDVDYAHEKRNEKVTPLTCL